ncbi:hypothetical protein B566_EDAN015492 [Ephemera danica]|nr:hypothetical protein B566_EDAN015492 [Ephemera danica]
MEPQGRVAQHSVAPYALAWPSTGHVIAAGCDKRIVVYGNDGSTVRVFDFGKDLLERDFSTACCSPSGQAVAIGSYDSWETQRREWSMETKQIRNLYSVSALAWRRDGSRLACSGLCGSIEVFESVLK